MQVPTTNLSAVFITAEGMTASQTYTLKNGVSVSDGITWNGINTTGTLSGGSDLTTATAALQTGQGMGGGPSGGGPGNRW